MAIGSGLAAQFGVSAESTFGTYVAPTRFFEVAAFDVKKVKTPVQGGGVAAGRLGRLAARRVVTSQAGTVSATTEATTTKLGLLLQHLMGTTVTPVQQGGTPAYLQTHAAADNVGKYLTVQGGVPNTAGTVVPYSATGCKITSAEFSCGVDETLSVKLDMDARQVVDTQSLATASYTTSQVPFHFGQMAVRIGATTGAAASVDGVRKVTLKIDRPQRTDRFYAGAGGLKAEPIMNDWLAVSGTIEADFLDKATFADRFAADTQFALVWEFVGAQISGAYYNTLRLTIPAAFIEGDTPTVGGPDVTSGSFPFVAALDGTNAMLTIEYISTDTTV